MTGYSQFILEIFDVLERVVESDFVKIFFSGYSTSYKTIRRQLSGALPFDRRPPDDTVDNRHRFRNLIYYLRKKGFIGKTIYKSQTCWKITDLGRERLRKFFFPKRKYKSEQDKVCHLCVFDIPEKERVKRDWLRASLVSLNFRMLQKSVWFTKNKIPQQFLEDLEQLNLADKIHIFRVRKNDLGALGDFK